MLWYEVLNILKICVLIERKLTVYVCKGRKMEAEGGKKQQM